jgi:hypothetical protein
MWDTAHMSYENLTARPTTAQSQAAEAAREFVPPQAIEALRNAQALQDAHDDAVARVAAMQKTIDDMNAAHAEVVAELAAEKEAHAKTQLALDAATATPEQQ